MDTQLTTPEVKANPITALRSGAWSAYGKGAEIAGDVRQMVEGNAVALITSGRTLGLGLKEMSEDSLSDSRMVLQVFASDINEFAEVKSPSEVLLLQGKLAARNFDAAVLYAKKHGSAVRELAGKVFAPLSERVQANVSTVRDLARS